MKLIVDKIHRNPYNNYRIKYEKLNKRANSK